MVSRQYALLDEREDIIHGQKVWVKVFEPVPSPMPGYMYISEELQPDPSANERRRFDIERVTHAGKTLHLQTWARKVGIPYRILRRRLMDGWQPEDALRVMPGSAEEQRIGGSNG